MEGESLGPLDTAMIENLRKVVIVVAILNLAYFGVEFTVAATTARSR